jgi:very-short-patch-repair endonuclease
MRQFKGTPEKLARARELRRKATPAERKVWTLLRGRRLLGLKFPRQHVIHGLIVDFFCAELKLVLEIDGPIHDQEENVDSDRVRSSYLESQGFHVLRISNDDVSEKHLYELLRTFMSFPSPAGRGDRGEASTERRGDFTNP